MKKFGRRPDDPQPRSPLYTDDVPSLIPPALAPPPRPVLVVAPPAPPSSFLATPESAPKARLDETVIHHPVISASLRDRVIEQIEPAAAATVTREVLRGQIEEIIHGIANKERLELSGREQLQLADEIADDMTGYGPLRPLLSDESISDIMINGPANVYVERHGKLERIAVRFRDNDHIASV